MLGHDLRGHGGRRSAAGNQTIPWPARIQLERFGWVTSYEVAVGLPRWRCRREQWARAASWTFYKPQPDGSLKGAWHTDISEGACRGSVVMPVAALPA